MLPIVFIHAGTSAYLPATFLQARAASPASARVLLGDWGSALLAPLVQRAPMRNYWRRAEALGRTFVNLSTNPADFERICLQRWCTLLEWMEAENVTQCLYLDSDVLLYGDAAHLAAALPAGTGMTVAGISAHTNFVLDRAVLAAFVDSILAAYATPAGLAELQEEYRIFKLTNAAGGISDMSFLTRFRAAHPGVVADIAEPHAGRAFDITIDYTAHYEAEHREIKRISWTGGLPYARPLGGGNLVQMATLHFQGASKRYIDDFTTVDKRQLKRWQRWNTLAVLATRAARRFGR